MKSLSFKHLATLALTLALAACASAPDAADPALLQQLDLLMRRAEPRLMVQMRLSTGVVNTGDPISAEVASGADGYLYVFQVGTDGRTLSMVFPNAMDGANYIAAGSTIRLPRANWRMAARGPAGVGHLVAVVSDKSLDILALQTNVGQGKLEVASPYGAAMATLRETAP
jgi:hypothetical protein